MKSSLFCLAVAAACLFAGSAHAMTRRQPNLHFGQASVLSGSNGCDSSNINSTVTPDGATLTVIFDEMMAQAGDGTGKTNDLKRCRFKVPVTLPEGHQIVQSKQDLRGTYSLPRGGSATIDVQHRFERTIATVGRVYRRFVGPVDYRDYTIEAYPMADAVSPCGGKTSLEFRADVSVSVPKKTSALAFGTLESIDALGHYSYEYRLVKCKK